MNQDTICALATANGIGAIGIIRVSGEQALEICEKCFDGKALTQQKSHTVHYGFIKDGDEVIDEVMVSIFLTPKSFTTENSVEISFHGSPHIGKRILEVLIKNGARMAKAGEFTMRAFMNGRIDLSQAESIADLIASENEASRKVALQQLKGGISQEISVLRNDLLNFVSLIELELDFAEEDVEFADRTALVQLLQKIESKLKSLIDSFQYGNAIKSGVAVAIIGKPNAGKSTLLNALLKEERAIVSDIAGTTRDTIEDELVINGIGFRFIDTAGIRETQDHVESIGIQKTFEKIEQAQVVMFLVDSTELTMESLERLKVEVEKIKNKYPQKALLTIFNKKDKLEESLLQNLESQIENSIFISAKQKVGIEELKNELMSFVNTGALRNNETIVTNTRHYDSLLKALEEIQKVKWGLDSGISSDLMAIDIRSALYFFGEITGEVTNDELLGNIFANFCIGK